MSFEFLLTFVQPLGATDSVECSLSRGTEGLGQLDGRIVKDIGLTRKGDENSVITERDPDATSNRRVFVQTLQRWILRADRCLTVEEDVPGQTPSRRKPGWRPKLCE